MMLVDAFIGEACLIYEGSWALQVCRELCKGLSSLWRDDLVLCGLDFRFSNVFWSNPQQNLLKELCSCIVIVALAWVSSLLISTDVKYTVSSIGKHKNGEDWRICALVPKSQQEEVPLQTCTVWWYTDYSEGENRGCAPWKFTWVWRAAGQIHGRHIDGENNQRSEEKPDLQIVCALHFYFPVLEHSES